MKHILELIRNRRVTVSGWNGHKPPYWSFWVDNQRDYTPQVFRAIDAGLATFRSDNLVVLTDDGAELMS